MILSTLQLDQLKAQAISVLRTNDIGAATKPAPDLYPHQWNWDSAFIAIGLSHIDSHRAQVELRSLLSGQWKNGMIPHIIFNPEAAAYYPGPAFWDIGLSEYAPGTALTSGITQPTVLAQAAYQIHINSQDKQNTLEFLGSIYEQLAKSFQFLRMNRIVDDTGLVCIVHPWESGLDNAPIWDQSLERIPLGSDTDIPRTDVTLIPDQERPTGADYSRYMFLVSLFKNNAYSQDRLLQKCPFLIQPVMFNALLNRDLEAMIAIGEILGRDDRQIVDWYQQLNSNFDDRLLDSSTGLYHDYDCRTGTPVKRDTFSGFTPIITGIPSSETIKKLVDCITSKEAYWPLRGFPVPSVSMSSDDFDPVKYWRGPVWINVNWLIIQGLIRHGYMDEATRLVGKTVELVQANGFFEYFHPISGKGHGADNFSWTASLIIDLIEQFTNLLSE